jgi:hypothetical protein
MVRVNDFVDPEYDRRLAEYKELKARRMKEMAESGQLPPRSQVRR